jgi:hypothetical protein
MKHYMTARHITAALLGLGVLLAAGATGRGAGEGAAVSPEQLAALHSMIKRQPGEARYLDIDWHPTVWEARQKAAREGKPLFIWAGSEGAPSAGC